MIAQSSLIQQEKELEQYALDRSLAPHEVVKPKKVFRFAEGHSSESTPRKGGAEDLMDYIDIAYNQMHDTDGYRDAVCK